LCSKIINDPVKSIRREKRMLENKQIKIFSDGADIESIKACLSNVFVKGFTTNPSLIAKAGVKNYKKFCLEVTDLVAPLPVSFEVFADDFDKMISQGKEISTWGENVYVKIPVSNTKGVFSGPVIKELVGCGIKLNVTAVFTLEQVEAVMDNLNNDVPAVISVFAGRIADTGTDPAPLMRKCKKLMTDNPNWELLWASPRELLNIFQAAEAGVDIITVPPDLLGKTELIGKDHEVFSLETVKMFFEDAKASRFSI